MMEHFRIVVANARNASDRWRSQYYDVKRGWHNSACGNSEDIYNKLCELGQNPPIVKVAEIIGNKSWSYISCSCCREYVSVAAAFDDDTKICEECAKDIHKALVGPG